MCGISGISGISGLRSPPHRPHSTDLAERLTAGLARHGPDAAGNFAPSPTLTFSHRRLSIIDLSPAGAQPRSRPRATSPSSSTERSTTPRPCVTSFNARAAPRLAGEAPTPKSCSRPSKGGPTSHVGGRDLQRTVRGRMAKAPGKRPPRRPATRRRARAKATSSRECPTFSSTGWSLAGRWIIKTRRHSLRCATRSTPRVKATLEAFSELLKPDRLGDWLRHKGPTR